jgi:hypothetical protein
MPSLGDEVDTATNTAHFRAKTIDLPALACELLAITALAGLAYVSAGKRNGPTSGTVS